MANIFLVWVGDRQAPDFLDERVESIKRLNPSDDVRLIRNYEADELLAQQPLWQPSIDAVKSPFLRADLVRYAALKTYGGWYFDLDCTHIKPLPSMESETKFCYTMLGSSSPLVATDMLYCPADWDKWQFFDEYFASIQNVTQKSVVVFAQQMWHYLFTKPEFRLATKSLGNQFNFGTHATVSRQPTPRQVQTSSKVSKKVLYYIIRDNDTPDAQNLIDEWLDLNPDAHVMVITSEAQIDPAKAAAVVDSTVEPYEIHAPQIHPQPQALNKDVFVPTTWEIGITTCPRRVPRLIESYDSLVAAGWENPIIFSDGFNPETQGEDATIPYPYNATIVKRQTWINGVSNFVLGLAELYQRNPHADMYAMMQDDVLHSPKVRHYIESVGIPKDASVISWYCPANYTAQSNGWHLINRGLSFNTAQTIAFTRDGLINFLSTPYVWLYRQGKIDQHSRKSHGTRNFDGMVGSWAKRTKRRIYVHTPSLARHIGDTSTMHGSVSLRGNRSDRSYIGDDVEATHLILPPTTTHDSTKEIALAGHNIATGVGFQNRDIASNVNIHKWFAVSHTHPSLPDHPDVDTYHCTNPNAKTKLIHFLGQNIGSVIFVERPPHKHLLSECRSRSIRTVCIPNAEWLPPACGGWAQFVDLHIAPNMNCFRQIHKNLPRSVYMPWPVDTEAFPFRVRERAHTYLYIAGNGGINSRKGTDIIHKAATMLAAKKHPARFIVYTQSDKHAHHDKKHSKYHQQSAWPSNVEVRGMTPTQAELYREGDVFLAPSRWEGIGLQLLEAQACGLPLITTNGPPMNEYNPWHTIKCTPKVSVPGTRTITVYSLDVAHLVSLIEQTYGQVIIDQSMSAGLWAKRRSWNLAANGTIEGLIRDPSTALYTKNFTYQDTDFSIRSLVDSTLFTSNFYERKLLEATANYIKEGDIILDVGASVGNHSVYWSSVCKCRLFSFEPHPSAYDALKENMQRANPPLPYSLLQSAAVGPNHSNDSLYLASPQNMSVGSAALGKSGVKVSAVRLSNFLRENKITPALIKLDTEGNEPDIMADLKPWLESLNNSEKPVFVIEYGKSEQRRKGITSILESVGYHQAGEYNATPTGLFLPPAP